MLKKALSLLLAGSLCVSMLAGCAPSKPAAGGEAPAAGGKTDSVAQTQAETKLVITKPGNVTPDKDIKEVVIEADGVTLENANLDKVTVSEKLGEGTANLKNVKAKALDIKGGGKNSVNIVSSEFGTIKVGRKEGLVHVVFDAKSTTDTFTVESNSVLDLAGKIQKVVASKGAKDSQINVEKGAKVENLTLEDIVKVLIDSPVASLFATGTAAGTQVEISADSFVAVLATEVKMEVKGEGAIKELITDKKDNVTSDIKPDKTTIQDNPIPGDAGTVVTPEPTNVPRATAKPTQTPAPTPEPEPEAPAPSTTVKEVTVVSGTAKTVFLIGEKMDYAGASVSLVFTDGGKKTVPYAEFAAKGITVSPAQGAEFTTEKTVAPTVTHTASGKSVALGSVFANVEPIDNVIKGIGYEPVEQEGDNPPYQLLLVHFNRVNALDSLAVTITDQNGRLIHKDSKLKTSQLAKGSFQTSFRYLGDVTDMPQAELDAIERANTAKLPVGTVMNITLDAVYKGHPYHYILKSSFTVRQSDFDLSYYYAADGAEAVAALAAVNAATDAATMQTALEANGNVIGIDISYYKTLTQANQTAVATAVYDSGTTYATLGDVKTKFRAEVVKVQTNIAPVITPKTTSVKVGVTPPLLTVEPNITNGTVDSYQWYISPIENANSGTIIVGATQSTYQPAAPLEAGESTYYFCRVTSLDNGLSVVFSHAASVTAYDMITGTVGITGDAKFGATLTAQAKDSNVGAAPVYQWQRSVNGADAVDISGANAGTYVLVKEDIGATISCVITAADKSGFITGAFATVIEKADAPAAPTVVLTANDAANEILLTAGEGKIDVTIGSAYTGLCEYSIGSSTSYAALPATITLVAGAQDINIRLIETDTYKASLVYTTEVTVKAVTYEVTINVNKDGGLFTGESKKIEAKLVADPSIVTELTQETTTGVYKGKLPNGEYTIFADAVDTGVTFTVKDAAVSAVDVNYYTLDITAKLDDTNTENVALDATPITAKYNDASVATGDVILGGGKLEVTAKKPTSNGTATAITYSWVGVDGAPVLTQTATIAKVEAKVEAVCTVTGVNTPLSEFALANADTLETVEYGLALKTDRTVTDDTAKGTGAITYQSNAPKVATVDATTGVVTIVGAGDVTISVTKAASDGFIATTKSYTIKVTPMALTYKEGLAAVADKMYDGTTAVEQNAIAGTIVVNEALPYGDVLTFTYTGVYDDKNVSDTSAMTITPTVVGDKATNYTFAAIKTITGKVTKATLQVTGLIVADHKYDGNKVAVIDSTAATLTGAIATDTIGTVTYPSAGTFATANVGTGIVVSQTGKTSADGIDATNYNIYEQAGLAGNIIKETPVISGTDKAVAYGGNAIDVSTLFTAVPADAIVTYEGTNGTGTGTFTTPSLTVTKAGTFTVTANVTATDNYNAATKSITLTVNKGAALAAPTIGKTDAAFGKTDGTITGLTEGKAYEIKKGSDVYADATLTGTTIAGLGAGVYTVREKQTLTDLYELGADSNSVIIAELADPATILSKVTVNKNAETIAIGATTATFTATAKNSTDGTLTNGITYLWEFVSGAGTAPTITTPSAESTTFDGASATAGTYSYRVTATQSGKTAETSVTITVS